MSHLPGSPAVSSQLTSPRSRERPSIKGLRRCFLSWASRGSNGDEGLGRPSYGPRDSLPSSTGGSIASDSLGSTALVTSPVEVIGPDVILHGSRHGTTTSSLPRALGAIAEGSEGNLSSPLGTDLAPLGSRSVSGKARQAAAAAAPPEPEPLPQRLSTDIDEDELDLRLHKLLRTTFVGTLP